MGIGITKVRKLIEDYADLSRFVGLKGNSPLLEKELEESKTAVMSGIKELSLKDARTIYREQMYLNGRILDNFLNVINGPNQANAHVKMAGAYVEVLQALQDRRYTTDDMQGVQTMLSEEDSIYSMIDEYSEYMVHNKNKPMTGTESARFFESSKILSKKVSNRINSLSIADRDVFFTQMIEARSHFPRLMGEEVDKIGGIQRLPENDISQDAYDVFINMLSIQYKHHWDMYDKYDDKDFGLIALTNGIIKRYELSDPQMM